MEIEESDEKKESW